MSHRTPLGDGLLPQFNNKKNIIIITHGKINGRATVNVKIYKILVLIIVRLRKAK